MAFFRREKIIGDGIEHHRRHQLPLALQPDGDGEMRNAVHEVGGAVYGIDDETMRAVLAFDRAGFLGQEAIAGPHAGQFIHQYLFGALVGAGDEIGGTLLADLEVFQFTEIADQRAAGFPGCCHHHVQGG